MVPIPSLAAAYFTPSPDAAVLEVLRAVRQLPAVSSGEVTRFRLFEALRQPSRGYFPDAASASEALWRTRFRPAPGGPLCESIFGPLGSEERTQRLGHLRSSQGLLHPALIPVIGELLGLSGEQVLAVAGYRAFIDAQRAFHLVEDHDWEGRLPLSGPGRLQALLKAAHLGAASALKASLAKAGFSPEELILHLVPVIPPALMPLELEDGDAVPGPIHVLYQRLLRHSHTVGRVTQSGPQPEHHLLRTEARHLQEMFGRLCRALSGELIDDTWDEPEDGAPARGEGPALGPPQSMVDLLNVYPEPTRIAGAAIAGPDSLLLAFPYALVQVRRGDGALLSIQPAPHGTIAWVDGYGRRAVIDGNVWSEEARGGDQRFFPLELQKGGWEGQLPGELVRTRFAEVREQSWLRDERTGRRLQLLELNDSPYRSVYTPDHRYLWAEDKEASGGIYHLQSGRLHAMPSLSGAETQALPLLAPDGQRSEPGSYAAQEWFAAARERYEEAKPPDALVRTARGTFRFYTGFVLIEDHRPLLRLAQYPLAAAFSRSGDELLLVDKEQAVLYAIGEEAQFIRVLARYPLAGLGELLSLEPLKEAAPELEEDETRARVLAAFGSLAGLASGSSARTPPQLDAGLVERLSAAARKCSWPDRLPPG